MLLWMIIGAVLMIALMLALPGQIAQIADSLREYAATTPLPLPSPTPLP